MKDWKKVKLADILFFQEGPGVRNTQFRENGVKLLNVGNINEGRIKLEATKIYISEEEAYDKYRHFLVDEGDLVIASSGIVVDNFHNKIAFIQQEHLPLCMNTSTIRFKSLDKSVIDIKFFSYYLQTRDFKNQLRKLVTGSAQLNFGPSHLKQIEFNLPDLATQQHIAKVLDQADALRQQNRQLLAHYDELLQATFIELFGDPVKNEKGWEVKKLGEVSEARLGKMLDSKKQTGLSKFKYLGNSNVSWGKFKLDNLMEMDFTEKEQKEFILKNGDLLICEGGEVGRCAIWREELEDCYFQKAIHRVRFNIEMAIPEYVQYLMLFFANNGGLKDYVTVATIAHLTGVKLKSLPIPIPPLPLQQHFAKIVETIEEQKEQAKASLAASEVLFEGLLAEYFG